jgi:hypothetical protein
MEDRINPDDQVNSKHYQPLLLQVPTETVYYNEEGKREAIILNVGIEFNLVQLPSNRNAGKIGAAPAPKFAINCITGETLEFEDFQRYIGEERMLGILESILWAREYDEDFDAEHAEYLDKYVKPLVDAFK